MNVNYITTNKLKFDIAKQFFEILDDYTLIQRKLHVPEIQDSSCEEIARQSARYAAQELREVCIVTDVGFSIDALKGFPGPFVKYVNEWLSEEQILRMLDNDSSRTVHFDDVLAIGFPNGDVKHFTHRVSGRLALEGEYTKTGWPANSLFIPDGYSIPLGSMTDEDQEKFWLAENDNWQSAVSYLSKQLN